MKFLHTSDLHLGLRLCDYPLNPDIRHALCEIVEIAAIKKCDAIVIAGDIYDRANPTPDSVAVFDEFVTAVRERGITLLAVYGNHDSPERVAYLSSVLKSSGVHFSAPYRGDISKVSFTDEYGRVNFYLIPFVKPSNMPYLVEGYEVTRADSYTKMLEYQLNSVNADKNERNVIVTHHFVAEDEGCVNPSVFECFDYTALGHLHTHHRTGKSGSGVYYSGSPVKCSFAETFPTLEPDSPDTKVNSKTVSIVTLGEKGSVSIENIPLTPLHELLTIRGKYEDLVSLSFRERLNRGGYFNIVLTDDDDIEDAAEKLRVVYPNLMKLSYDNTKTRSSAEYDFTSLAENDALTPIKVFSELYELQNGIPTENEVIALAEAFFNSVTEGGLI